MAVLESPSLNGPIWRVRFRPDAQTDAAPHDAGRRASEHRGPSAPKHRGRRASEHQSRGASAHSRSDQAGSFQSERWAVRFTGLS